MSNAGKTGLVVTAHPGDFVWRAGGAIALHAKKGYRMKIVCMSFGERGESQFAWKEAGATLEKVKAGRKDEAERGQTLQAQGEATEAATVLGRALAIREKELGPNNPQVAASLKNLMELYRALGRDSEAEALAKRGEARRAKSK